ncbi:MAG: hypothetical protein KC431_32135 [Myxococcales bacterium]|nr:hypothetical protein [Myxococcales bacterium]
MLVTEIAPVTSLVQRFGRSNRATSRPETDRSAVLWYPPEQHLPYTHEELRAGRALLEGLGAAEVSQRRLAEALAEHAPAGPAAQPSASFLTGGYYAVPGSLREDTDYTVTAVLETDLDALLALKRARKTYDGLLVPVPRRHILDVESRPGELPRHIEIAPSRHYSQTRGFIAPEGE